MQQLVNLYHHKITQPNNNVQKALFTILHICPLAFCLKYFLPLSTAFPSTAKSQVLMYCWKCATLYGICLRRSCQDQFRKKWFIYSEQDINLVSINCWTSVKEEPLHCGWKLNAIFLKFAHNINSTHAEALSSTAAHMFMCHEPFRKHSGISLLKPILPIHVCTTLIEQLSMSVSRGVVSLW